jgi:hypothetical protein
VVVAVPGLALFLDGDGDLDRWFPDHGGEGEREHPADQPGEQSGDE